MTVPVLSIITAVRNRADMIARALDSAAHNQDPHIEHWVIDGASTDGTQDAVQRYPKIKSISEPDHGLYDAMNKGARLARGRYLLFLHSDDWLLPGALDALVAAAQQGGAAMLSGGAHYLRLDAGRGETLLAVWNDEALKHLDDSQSLIGNPMTNARLYGRAEFLALGGFDLRYPLVADRDFLLRWRQAEYSNRTLAPAIYAFVEHDGSLTFNRKGANHRLYAEQRDLADAWWGRTKDQHLNKAAKILFGRSSLRLAQLDAQRPSSALSWLAYRRGRFSLAPSYAACAAITQRIGQIFLTYFCR